MTKRLLVLVCGLALGGYGEAHALVRPIVFPVNGESSFKDDFLDPRGGGTRQHLGVDILANKMTPVVAAVDGVVSYVVSPQASWGFSISIRDSEGYQYRYLHLNNDTPGTDDGKGGETYAYAPGITRGANVAQGQLIGWVGDSGNAEGTAPHLHFEIRDPSRAPISPYESLFAAASTASGAAVTSSGSRVDVEASSSTAPVYIFTATLSMNSRGDEVRELQLWLQALGYYEYPEVTGYFGVATRDAVAAFQSSNGIDPIGIVGPKTREALNRISIVGLSKSKSIAGPVTEVGYGFEKTLAVGARGEEVRQLQIRLKALGYFNYEEITGYFGSVTNAAVVAFQRANGIDPVGIVGPKTREALNSV